jgi:hypothetical protein
MNIQSKARCPEFPGNKVSIPLVKFFIPPPPPTKKMELLAGVAATVQIKSEESEAMEGGQEGCQSARQRTCSMRSLFFFLKKKVQSINAVQHQGESKHLQLERGSESEERMRHGRPRRAASQGRTACKSSSSHMDMDMAAYKPFSLPCSKWRW